MGRRASPKEKVDDKDILATLRYVPFLQAFSDKSDDLADFIKLISFRRVPAGQVLFREGEMGKELYILQRGEVEVTRRTLENEQYTVAVLSAREHDFFGELALLDEDHRSATIRTVQDCELLVLNRDDFEKYSNDHPEFGLPIVRALAKILCRRFRSVNHDVILLFEALVREVRSEEIG